MADRVVSVDIDGGNAFPPSVGVQLGTVVMLRGDVARNHPTTGTSLPNSVQVIWISATQPAAMDATRDIWMTF